MNRKLAARITAPLAALGIFAGAASSAHAQGVQSLASAAQRAYDDKQYAECARLHVAAIEQGSRSFLDRYAAACCYALEGRNDAAFAMIDAAITAGFTAAQHFAGDEDLASLHTDPRWNDRVEKVRRAEAEYLASLNSELARMKEEDQAVRRQQPLDFEKMAAGDAIRYQRVKEMIAADELRAADDYYNAALIMQHGSTVEDYELAHRLATRAVEINANHPSARWLAAAAKDRSLWAQGRPQIYGTQFQSFSKDGLYTMEPFDRDAVTDAQRQDAGVRTLVESEERLEKMNQRTQ